MLVGKIMSAGKNLFNTALIGTQIIQARQQAQIKNALQNQLNLSMNQQEQSNKIAFGRQFLIRIEEILLHSRKVIDKYPYYAYCNLFGYRRQFVENGFDSNYFTETEDIRHASGLLDKLNAELEYFLEQFPDAHDVYEQLLEAQKKLFDDANDFDIASKAHAFIESKKEKQEILSKKKKELKKKKKQRGEESAKVVPWVAIILFSLLVLAPEAGLLWVVLGFFIMISLNTTPQLSPDWKKFEAKLRTKEILLKEMMKKYNVSTTDELFQIQIDALEFFETYMPTDPKYFTKGDLQVSQ